MVGLQVTFYICTVLADQFYVMMEICSITLPKDLTKILSHFANIGDLCPVIQYYESSLEMPVLEPRELQMEAIDVKKNHCDIKRQKKKMPCGIHSLIIRTIFSS